MPDLFVLNDDLGGHGFAGQQRKVLAVERRDQMCFAGVGLAESEDVDSQSVFQISVRDLHLFIVAVEARDGGIGARPAMRCNLTLFGAVIVHRSHSGHVARLAG